MCSLYSYFKYLTTGRRQRRVRKGGSADIHSSELMASWIYDEKFLTGIRFLFETLSFKAREDDDLEHSAQEQEEQRTMTICFEIHRCLKNSVFMFQTVVRQPATTNLINSPARLPIGIPSVTT
jgi:hypothetical protein